MRLIKRGGYARHMFLLFLYILQQVSFFFSSLDPMVDAGTAYGALDFKFTNRYIIMNINYQRLYQDLNS